MFTQEQMNTIVRETVMAAVAAVTPVLPAIAAPPPPPPTPVITTPALAIAPPPPITTTVAKTPARSHFWDDMMGKAAQVMFLMVMFIAILCGAGFLYNLGCQQNSRAMHVQQQPPQQQDMTPVYMMMLMKVLNNQACPPQIAPPPYVPGVFETEAKPAARSVKNDFVDEIVDPAWDWRTISQVVFATFLAPFVIGALINFCIHDKPYAQRQAEKEEEYSDSDD